MKASDVIVRCLENEGVRYVFGVPGEEILDIIDSLVDSRIAVRAHSARAGGRLHGGRLGPSHRPRRRLPGHARPRRDQSRHRGRRRQPRPRAARGHHRPGRPRPDPQGVAPVRGHRRVDAAPDQVEHPARGLRRWCRRSSARRSSSRNRRSRARATSRCPRTWPRRPRRGRRLSTERRAGPRRIAGAARRRPAHRGGVLSARSSRATASSAAARPASSARSPAVTASRWSTPSWPRAVCPTTTRCVSSAAGLQARDYVSCGFEKADLIISVGYDPVEYAPRFWNPDKKKPSSTSTSRPPRWTATTSRRSRSWRTCARRSSSWADLVKGQKDPAPFAVLRRVHPRADRGGLDDDTFPIKPQRILRELRAAMGREDILVSDVGSHKLWVARTFPAYEPNTVLISNGYAAMGFALPAAIAAKLAPSRAAGRRGVRRRRLPHERPGAGDRAPARRRAWST